MLSSGPHGVIIFRSTLRALRPSSPYSTRAIRHRSETTGNGYGTWRRICPKFLSLNKFWLSCRTVLKLSGAGVNFDFLGDVPVPVADGALVIKYVGKPSFDPIFSFFPPSLYLLPDE